MVMLCFHSIIDCSEDLRTNINFNHITLEISKKVYPIHTMDFFTHVYLTQTKKQFNHGPFLSFSKIVK